MAPIIPTDEAGWTSCRSASFGYGDAGDIAEVFATEGEMRDATAQVFEQLGA